MPETNYARTIVQAAIAQGAAGSTDLVAAPGVGLKIYVVNIVVALDAAGSIKFQENAATDLSGAMPVAINSGFVELGSGLEPVIQTNTANLKLNIVTVTGKAFGWFRYFIAA